MNISVFCASSHPKDPSIAQAAESLGRLLAQGGHTLLYGGSNLGLMGCVSSSTYSGGGEVVAVIPTFFSEEIIMSQPVSKLVRVKSMAERKEYLIANSDAFIALPGGIGTLDEVLEVLVHNQLGSLRDKNHRDKPVVLYNPDGFWDHFLRQIEQMGLGGFYRSGKAPKLITSDNIEKIVSIVTSDQ